MNEIEIFLKTDIRGLILLAIITSTISALLYEVIKKQAQKGRNILRKYRRKKLSNRSLISYAKGYTAGYANDSSYRQIVLTGNHIIRIIIRIGIILIYSIFLVALLILIGQPFSWIFIILFTILLTVQYKKLKDQRNEYEIFMQTVFGEELYKSIEKSIEKHIDDQGEFNLKSEEK